MKKINTDNQVVKIELVKPNEYNPKPDFNERPEFRKNYEEIFRSVESEGQVIPIIVREIDSGFEIIDGFHRYLAMKELGYEEIEIKNLGRLTLEEAIGVTLKIEEAKMPTEMTEVNILLKKLYESGYKIETLPYSTEEIMSRIESVDFDWENFEESKRKAVDSTLNTETFTFVLDKEMAEIVTEALITVKGDDAIDDNQALFKIANWFNLNYKK